MQTPQVQNVMAAMSVQQPQGSQPAPFCGVPGTELAAMAQSWAACMGADGGERAARTCRSAWPYARAAVDFAPAK